jgi:adenylate kinase
MKLIMLGAPGVGKGTQAKILSEKYNIPHVSTGDIFRENIKNNTQLGQKAKEYMDKGLLVPDELVIDIVIDRLSKDDAMNGYILDGFPRTIPQAKSLDEALKKMKTQIDHVIDIEVPDEKIILRMSGRRACVGCGATYHIKYNPPKKEDVCDLCGSKLILRDDDKEETVLNRLKVYKKQTQPLIDYHKDKIISIDGTKDINVITQDIVKYLMV